MKILHINAIYGRLSTGTIVKDIQELCIASGIESYAVAPIVAPGFECREVYHMGNAFDEKVHALLSRITGKQAYFSTIPTLMLLKHIKSLKPDIVHLHNLHNNFINYPMLMKHLNKCNVQVIVTLHDCWFYTGGCTHYTHLNCDKWLQSCGKCPDTHIKLYDSSRAVLNDRMRFFRGRWNVTVVGVSDWIRRESIRNVFHGCKNFTVYNGIDQSVFRPSPSNLRKQLGLEGKCVILGPATKWLDPIRKQDFVDFAANLKKDEVLLLFGCKDLQMQVPERVLLYGFTYNREELAQLYSMADVFANCSYEESLSLINVECQACGTPVVTFDNTGMAETVDGTSGLKVKSGDYHELLLACRRIISDNDDNLTKMRLDYMAANFEKTSNYKKMVDIYKSLLSNV